MRDDVLPLVIVGCGPAGLAAASVLRSRAPGLPWLAVEAGGALARRQRNEPHDILAGVGGAGLYSDGKFSFYPAATELWRLEDAARLRAAYAWVRSLLSEAGVTAPAFPAFAAPPAPATLWKPYPSLRLDLPARRALIERLYAPIGEQVWLRTKLLDLERAGDGTLRLTLDRRGSRVTLRTRTLLGAGGRFFPLRLGRCAGGTLPMRFRRWEVGLRIEGATTHPFFTELRMRDCGRDPKLIFRAEGRAVEWRTFCCCVDGEVIETHCDGFRTLSGRADVAPTGRSNIGFNVRFLGAGAGTLDLTRLRGRRPFRVPLAEAIERPAMLDAVYGAAGRALREGLRRFRALFPSLGSGAAPLTAAGPVLEGVGSYPETTACLAMEGWPIYCAGDACGKFRGLVAALVSGVYAAETIAADFSTVLSPSTCDTPATAVAAREATSALLPSGAATGPAVRAAPWDRPV